MGFGSRQFGRVPPTGGGVTALDRQTGFVTIMSPEYYGPTIFEGIRGPSLRKGLVLRGRRGGGVQPAEEAEEAEEADRPQRTSEGDAVGGASRRRHRTIDAGSVGAPMGCGKYAA